MKKFFSQIAPLLLSAILILSSYSINDSSVAQEGGGGGGVGGVGTGQNGTAQGGITLGFVGVGVEPVQGATTGAILGALGGVNGVLGGAGVGGTGPGGTGLGGAAYNGPSGNTYNGILPHQFGANSEPTPPPYEEVSPTPGPTPPPVSTPDPESTPDGNPQNGEQGGLIQGDPVQGGPVQGGIEPLPTDTAKPCSHECSSGQHGLGWICSCDQYGCCVKSYP